MIPTFSPLLLISAILATPPVPGPVRPEMAIKRLSACGFHEIHIRYDQTFQEDVIEIRDGDEATDEALGCAARTSIATIYYVSMPDALQPRYDAIYQRLSVEDDIATARKWFARRGMLARLPRYDKSQDDDEAFAKRLEQYCGIRAKGALQSELGPHAISQAWLNQQLHRPDKGTDIVKCLTNGATATGFSIGFTGKEAPAPTK